MRLERGLQMLRLVWLQGATRGLGETQSFQLITHDYAKRMFPSRRNVIIIKTVPSSGNSLPFDDNCRSLPVRVK